MDLGPWNITATHCMPTHCAKRCASLLMHAHRLEACADQASVAPPHWAQLEPGAATGAASTAAREQQQQQAQQQEGGEGGDELVFAQEAAASRLLNTLFYGVKGLQEQEADTPSYHNPMVRVCEVYSERIDCLGAEVREGLHAMPKPGCT